ncbi:MAG: amino acid ABC transporter permease [Actinomycetota bacterium]
MKSRWERIRDWIAGQTRTSIGIAGLGVAAFGVTVAGSLVFISIRGWSPFDDFVATITSDAQGLLLWIGIALGVAAVATGTLAYRRMPTRPARVAAITGAVLGVQAIGFSALYLWFRAGDPEVFVRNFLKFDELEGLSGAFADGAKNTVILALAAEGLGIGIGLVLALFALSKRAAVRAPARAYINFIRGTPLVWQLSFLSIVMIVGFGLFRRNPYPIAIIILGLNAGGYSAEIFRAGIQSIERGQLEAARSLGMSYLQAMRYAVIPQAIRRVIPPLTNEFVILIKDTSLVFVLGLSLGQRELLAVGRDAYSETFNATPFLGTALGYLVVTLPMIRAVNWLERRLRSGLAGIAG